MDEHLFEQLLLEGEGVALDFKIAQYPFSDADDRAKSELLKDILGMANAWRKGDAYILIGVREVTGGPAEAVGIPADAHLPDHSLQQFVNNKTNKPIRFHYEAITIGGKNVGVIRIEQQEELPFYLKADYGKLNKAEVYVRRGSCTDPTKPAAPEEIALMGKKVGAPVPELVVEFADPQRDQLLGHSLSWEAEFCAMPTSETIPALRPSRRMHPSGIDLSGLDGVTTRDQLNPNFHRELAEYEFAKRLARPLRLAIRNIGSVAAKTVRVELYAKNDVGIMLLKRSQVPRPPKRREDPFKRLLRDVAPRAKADQGEITIETRTDSLQIVIDCGNLQPGRQILSDAFYLAIANSGETQLTGKLLADNLSQPKDLTLTVNADVRHTKLSLAELLSLPDPPDAED